MSPSGMCALQPSPRVGMMVREPWPHEHFQHGTGLRVEEGACRPEPSPEGFIQEWIDVLSGYEGLLIR
jgi:hypothetical protein